MKRKEKRTKEETKFRTSIGGQALIEGIMMRGPEKQCIVVRTKKGLVSKTTPLKLTKDRNKILGWPFIRGVVNFGASMSNGVRALMYAANFMVEEASSEDESEQEAETAPETASNVPQAAESAQERPETDTPSQKTAVIKDKDSKFAEGAVVTVSVILGIALSVGLFILLPTVLAKWLTWFTDITIIKNLIEGVIRIVIFIGYISLSSLLKDMKRVWMYHGAEHKTIFAYEKELPLTVENVRIQPRCHPRCGTSFMFLVMFISILVFSLFSWSNTWIRLATRIAMLPVVVAISYEIIKLAGRYDNIATRIISAPGKWLQRFTTREPDDGMIEVAIEAIKEVIPAKAGEDAW